jgi:hypothetical protein
MRTKTMSQRSVLVLLIAVLWVAQLAGSTPASAAAPIYLPWQAGESHKVLQGPGGATSHSSGNTRYAWDFSMPVGTPLLASAPGTVQIAQGGCGEGYWGDPCNGGWGNYVVICHDQETCTWYAHLSAIDVGAGAQVGQAQVIGRSGISGDRMGDAHVHFAVTRPGSSQSIPYSFVEAGNPQEGSVVTSRNGESSAPVFDPLKVYSLDPAGGVAVEAGGPPVAVDVTSVFRGPKPIPCGYARLGRVGDADAPYRNDSAGPWPKSVWVSPNRVQIVGCEGNGYLDPGEPATWRLSFLVPADAPVGLFSTGVWAPVSEGVAWSQTQAEIKLDIKPPVDRVAPELKFSRTSGSIAAVRRGGLGLRARCNEDCTVGALVTISRKTARRLGFRGAKGPVLIGARTAPLAGGRTGKLRIGLTKTARKRLRGTVAVQVTMTATDAAGNTTPVPRVRVYTLRR